MSSSTSRKLPAEALTHPDVIALVKLGKAVGEVSAEAVRQTTDSAGISPQHLRALLKLLSQEGVSVSVSAADTGRKQVAAATSTAKKVTSAAAKKAPAKKAPAKKATKNDAPATDVVEADEAPVKTPAKKTTKKAAAKTSAAKKAVAKKSTAKKA